MPLNVHVSSDHRLLPAGRLKTPPSVHPARVETARTTARKRPAARVWTWWHALLGWLRQGRPATPNQEAAKPAAAARQYRRPAPLVHPTDPGFRIPTPASPPPHGKTAPQRVHRSSRRVYHIADIW